MIYTKTTKLGVISHELNYIMTGERKVATV